MADLEKVGSGSSAGVLTVTANPTVQLNAGDEIFVCLSDRDNGVTGVADNSGQAGAANVYTKDASREVVGEDAFVFIFRVKLTRTILATDTITATFGAAGGPKFMAVLRVTGGSLDAAPLDKVSSRNYAAGTTLWTSNAVAATAQADELAIGIAAFGAATVIPTDAQANPDAPWTERHFGAGAGGGIDVGTRVLNAIGTPEYSGTWTVAEDGPTTVIIATYKIAAGGTVYNSSPTGRIEMCGNAIVGFIAGTITGRRHHGPRRPRRRRGSFASSRRLPRKRRSGAVEPRRRALRTRGSRHTRRRRPWRRQRTGSSASRA